MGRPIDTIIQGDALSVLKTLDSDSIDCCITSPPYWALRDYKTEGQLGLEPTFNEYLDRLIEIFREVKRVTKGVIWVNIGDTYMPHNGTRGNKTHAGADSLRKDYDNIAVAPMHKKQIDVPMKSLCGIPERFAIRMTDELGLIRRNTIIWHKPNCMPSSARDRFTIDFEYVYMFVKKPRYYFETQYEPVQDKGSGWKKTGGKYYPNIYKNKELNNRNFSDPNYKWDGSLGRLKRCVWRVSTKPFSGAHFATFPPQLIEPMIKSSCPVDGICLDPFMGAGTVAVTARALNRHFLGIELNADYVAMANARLGIPITSFIN